MLNDFDIVFSGYTAADTKITPSDLQTEYETDLPNFCRKIAKGLTN